ncbi:MSHA biogenesis protein MshI [Azospirillaceae bacterium]
MTLGRYDANRRYQQRVWGGAVKMVFFLVLLLVDGLFSYQMGVEQFKKRDANMKADVTRLSLQKGELELLAKQLKDAALTAEARAEAVEKRLAREVPTGDLARLVQLANERLTTGVSVERLAFVISAVQNRRNCQASETKRFVPSTPIYKSPNRSISFANGAITLTGEGQSARDNAGNAEGWYDPSQPVTIRIIPLGGKEVVLTGNLPLHHSVVVDNTEYRFVIITGARSFIEATADRCPFP